MDSNVHGACSGAAQPRPCAWLDDAAPLLSSAALTLLGLLGTIALANFLDVDSRKRTMFVFIASVLVFPVFAVTLQDRLDFRWSRAARLFEALNVWWAVVTLASFAAIAIAAWADSDGVNLWLRAGLRTAKIAVSAYVALALLLLAACQRRALVDRASIIVARASSRAIQTIALAVVFAATTIAIFKIEPLRPHFNSIFALLFPAPPGGFPDRSTLLLATLTAALIVAIGAGLLILERRLAAEHAAGLRSAQRFALAIAIAASALLCFDFSLAADPFHYMTVIGPVLQLLHGGTLMVDTFSQYGPGPVLVTYLAFRIGPPSFAVANIAIQLCNLTFYGLFLIALWQSTRSRMTAVWFGLAFILFWLSAWDSGQGNVNSSPSVLGARYLPIMLMAVGLGSLRDARHSMLTFVAGFLSSVWSIEAFIGSAALYAGTLTLMNLRDLSYGRLARDLAIAALPMIAGLAALSIGTLVAAGSWPDFDVYLGFLSSYNPLARFWSVSFDATFWGWLPILAAVAMATAGSWSSINNRRVARQTTGEAWLRHVLPAAILTAVTGAYFAGRSVDFTIAIALLPFALLFVPAALELAGLALGCDRVATGLTAIAATAVFWASIFSCLYVFRVDSPYALLLHECRDYDRCSPTTLTQSLSRTASDETALRTRSTFWSLDDYDRAIVVDAKHLIEQFSGNATKVTVLLGGSSDGWQMLSDIVLMYANKWHTWPRSFTFSDELVPALLTRILASNVTLKTGDLIVQRRDDTSLGLLEKGIIDRIRAQGTLCELPGSTSEIVAYRFRKAADPQDADACRKQNVELADDDAERSRQRLADLAALINAARAANRALPDGPLNFPALERAGAAVPASLVAGRRLVSFSGFLFLQKSGSSLTIDLFPFPQTVCRQLLLSISRLAGVERVAVTAALADEQSVPISQAQSDLLCAQNTRLLRIIADLEGRSRK